MLILLSFREATAAELPSTPPPPPDRLEVRAYRALAAFACRRGRRNDMPNPASLAPDDARSLYQMYAIKVLGELEPGKVVSAGIGNYLEFDYPDRSPTGVIVLRRIGFGIAGIERFEDVSYCDMLFEWTGDTPELLWEGKWEPFEAGSEAGRTEWQSCQVLNKPMLMRTANGSYGRSLRFFRIDLNGRNPFSPTSPTLIGETIKPDMSQLNRGEFTADLTHVRTNPTTERLQWNESFQSLVPVQTVRAYGSPPPPSPVWPMRIERGFLWETQPGYFPYDRAGECMLDPGDHAYLVGSIDRTIVRISENWHVRKVSPDGKTIWQDEEDRIGESKSAAGPPRAERALHARLDPAGALLVAGWARDAAGGANPVSVVRKYSPKGDVLWTRTAPGPRSMVDSNVALELVRDGSVVIGTVDGAICAISPEGAIVRTRALGAMAYPGSVHFTAVAVTTSGAVLRAGWIGTTPKQVERGIILSHAPSGNIAWSCTVPGIPRSIQPLRDGAFAVLTITKPAIGLFPEVEGRGWRMCLLSSSGILTGLAEPESDEESTPRAVIEDPSGGLVVAGSALSEPGDPYGMKGLSWKLTRFTRTGRLESVLNWSRSSGAYGTVRAGAFGSDGQMIVVGEGRLVTGTHEEPLCTTCDTYVVEDVLHGIFMQRFVPKH